MTDRIEKNSNSGYHPTTRWLHTILVLGVVFQLFCAALMSHPEHKGGKHAGSVLNHGTVAVEVHPLAHKDLEFGDILMAAHRTGGVFVVLIVLANLLWAVFARGKPRKRQIAVLFSARHWCEAITIAKHLPSMIQEKRALPEPGNSLSLVFEMLGLLIMTTMAVTGSIIWGLWDGPGNMVSSQAEFLMGMHASAAMMLLFYLAGHISMAFIHARAGDPVFARILPWRRNERV